MRRFTVLGFTEAELGFVLAALFAAMAVAAVGASSETANAELERDKIAAERDSIRRELASLRDSLAKANAAKRSTKTPQCWERGESRAPIASLHVAGANLYEIDGEQLDYQGVRTRLAPFIARSDSLRCRYLVIARSTRGLDATDHTTAVWRLRRHFDVDDRAR